MPMTIRERMKAVYVGKQPDQVPYILDLSHYYYDKYKKPWLLLNSYVEPEREMIDFHRQHGAGFFVPNQMKLYDLHYDDGVKSDAWIEKVNGNPETHWRFETPLGAIERIRVWSEQSYSWPIKKYGVETEEDIRILAYAMGARRFTPAPGLYSAWEDYVGDDGMTYLSLGLSAMGYLMHYWMGLENTVFACYEWNETVHDAIDRINASNLDCLKMLMGYSGYVVIIGDNFSTDCQPPDFFAEWSAKFYRQAADIIHDNGKKLAVHIDGQLGGSIKMIKDIGADIIDAVTPKPMFDLTPQECRDEAGDGLILSGGVPPTLWLPDVPVAKFEQSVMEWLELKHRSPALIASAGDQAPPRLDEKRIGIMRRLIDEHGRY